MEAQAIMTHSYIKIGGPCLSIGLDMPCSAGIQLGAPICRICAPTSIALFPVPLIFGGEE